MLPNVMKHDKSTWQEIQNRADGKDAKAIIAALMLLASNIETAISHLQDEVSRDQGD